MSKILAMSTKFLFPAFTQKPLFAFFFSLAGQHTRTAHIGCFPTKDTYFLTLYTHYAPAAMLLDNVLQDLSTNVYEETSHNLLGIAIYSTLLNASGSVFQQIVFLECYVLTSDTIICSIMT